MRLPDPTIAYFQIEGGFLFSGRGLKKPAEKGSEFFEHVSFT
jgi:hypothetical protein